MNRADKELDEYGKRTLAPLRPSPPLDPLTASEAKAKYLLKAENFRQTIRFQPENADTLQMNGKLNIFGTLQHKSMMKALAAFLLAFMVILAGSSFTVFASQSSLPGQALYTVKSWSEDVRLSMTSSPDARLNLTLDFTNQRLEEISSLLEHGNTINEQTADRFQRELEDALLLAVQLDDTQMQLALEKIKSHAENQGLTIQELINKLPPQADAAILRLQELNEQVQLSNVETDPKEFRVKVNERSQRQQNPKHSPDTGKSKSTPDETATTPMPLQNGDRNGNEIQTTDVPGHGGQGKDQDQTPSGNGNHELNPTHTPKP
jgi:hypothetical protein